MVEYLTTGMAGVAGGVGGRLSKIAVVSKCYLFLIQDTVVRFPHLRVKNKQAKKTYPKSP